MSKLYNVFGLTKMDDGMTFRDKIILSSLCIEMKAVAKEGKGSRGIYLSIKEKDKEDAFCDIYIFTDSIKIFPLVESEKMIQSKKIDINPYNENDIMNSDPCSRQEYISFKENMKEIHENLLVQKDIGEYVLKEDKESDDCRKCIFLFEKEAGRFSLYLYPNYSDDPYVFRDNPYIITFPDKKTFKCTEVGIVIPETYDETCFCINPKGIKSVPYQEARFEDIRASEIEDRYMNMCSNAEIVEIIKQNKQKEEEKSSFKPS